MGEVPKHIARTAAGWLKLLYSVFIDIGVRVFGDGALTFAGLAGRRGDVAGWTIRELDPDVCSRGRPASEQLGIR